MNTALGIIGYPIGHSISPRFQQAALDGLSINADYRAYEVHPDGVGDFVASLRGPGVLGINVTVPHKEAVMPFLDEIDDWAAEAGAVNTIVNRGGRLAGYNTDGYGFLRALRESGGLEPAGKRGLILGAGGSARGVVQALLRAGIAELVIANRTVARAQSLAELATERNVVAEAIPLEGGPLGDAAAAADLIVNCTSLGMRHGPDESATPLGARQIPAAALVYDLVYNPMQTPLLRAAEQAGASTLGGISMLVYQGAASFEIWLERPAPVAVMMDAAMAAMQEAISQ
ncbi:MAG: shikimate dehydrogenase [Chloroflexi bacterium]|nr:shikimate dehydrogenase [Chloroflexota bacterium]